VTGFRSTYPLLTRWDDDEPIAGQLVEQVESRGKWLLIRFSSGGTLATHMLMNGNWHIYRPGERWQQPRVNMRIVLENSEYVTVGFRVPVAKMLRAHELERAIRIPPQTIDVLSEKFDAEEVARRVAAHGTEEIADVLLHQEVMAGVGNEFKSEICFVNGLNPFRKTGSLTRDEATKTIASAQMLLRANVLEDSGDGIVTYEGRKRRTTHESDPGESLWVYNRKGKPCRRCGELIRSRMQGQGVRVTYWYPRCQRVPDGGQIDG